MRHTPLAALLAAAALLPGPTFLAARAQLCPIRSDPTGFHIAGSVSGAATSIDLGATSARFDVGLSWWAGR